MRRQHFAWTYLVTASVFTIYGGGILIYNFQKKNYFSVLSFAFLMFGLGMFITYLVLFLCSYFKKKKLQNNKPVEETKKVEEELVKAEEKKEEAKPAEKPVEKPVKKATSKSDVTYVSNRVDYRRPSSRSVETVYVRQVGYGPVLRINGNRILDMRNNAYYRIEGSNVNLEGSGPAFEISSNRIRAAFGNYLYEIYGSNINKVYGGFFASVSGSYITTFDSSIKLEVDGDVSQKQILVIAALIFGSY